MRNGTRAAAALLLLVSSSGSGTTDTEPATLKALYKQAKTGEYVAPYQEDLAQAEQLFRRTLTETWDAELRLAWSALGFEFFEHQERGESFGVLRETGERLTGRGFYVFRSTPGDPKKLLQIPHGYSDLYTGTLGAKMMLEGDFRAAAWNTVPRAEVDLAHTEASHFNALNRAFGALFPNGQTVQIHGFAQAKRKTIAGQQADFILSNGTMLQNDAVRRLDECLTRGSDYAVSSYPEEVQELGGTTNAQGKALRGLGNLGFLHVEMSYPFRKTASGRKALRSILTGCLQDL